MLELQRRAAWAEERLLGALRQSDFREFQALFRVRGFAKGWFSKRVVLADVPPERKQK